MSKTVITNSEQETFDFGRQLGKNCRGGEVFVLIGDLGAGKTKLIQGLAAGLGVRESVNSPTFNILKLYKIAESRRAVKEFCHIDAYRLRAAADLAALGAVEYFYSPDTVTAIEWADRVRSLWPTGAKLIQIRALSDVSEQKREIIYS